MSSFGLRNLADPGLSPFNVELIFHIGCNREGYVTTGGSYALYVCIGSEYAFLEDEGLDVGLAFAVACIYEYLAVYVVNIGDSDVARCGCCRE